MILHSYKMFSVLSGLRMSLWSGAVGYYSAKSGGDYLHKVWARFPQTTSDYRTDSYNRRL